MHWQVPNLKAFLEFQTHIFDCLVRSQPESLLDISNLTSLKLSSWYSPQNLLLWKSSYLSNRQLYSFSYSGHIPCCHPSFTPYQQVLSAVTNMLPESNHSPTFTATLIQATIISYLKYPTVSASILAPHSHSGLFSTQQPERLAHKHKSDHITPIVKTHQWFLISE